MSIDRRRFNLAHELGHLLMDTRAVDDKMAEKLAHRFAAALLVPAERAFYELGTRRTRLELEELGFLKRKYGLSMTAWLIRARDLDIITENHYTQLQMEMSKNGWRKKEPVAYIGDETPLKLNQMAHHAVAEGLMSPDRIRRVYPQWKEHARPRKDPEQFSIYDLLVLPESEQVEAMEAAVALALAEDIELFEANEFLE